MKVSEFETLFPHPQMLNSKIHVILNACHMYKLIRNLTGDHAAICHEETGDFKHIKCQHIDDLITIHDDQGFT